jgi:hypothetical protein
MVYTTIGQVLSFHFLFRFRFVFVACLEPSFIIRSDIIESYIRYAVHGISSQFAS